MLFDVVREVALALPGVEASTKYDGSTVLKLGGSFLAGLATHPSAEPDTLIIRATAEDRQGLIDDAPETYYLTEYYKSHPVVLVRLNRVDRQQIQELLSISLRLTLPKAKIHKRRT